MVIASADLPLLRRLVLFVTLVSAAGSAAGADQPVAARGFIEPKDGLYAISGPSGAAAVVSKLMVDVGQEVKKGDLIALLDDVSIREANVERAKAQRANAVNELNRNKRLVDRKMISSSELEALELRVTVADADLALAHARLERTHVKSPIDGRVIAVHTRDGERVGPEGIVELGRTREMLVKAEVYETDIGRVRVGQRATASTPVLDTPLTGVVERIGLTVGRLEPLATDPVSRTDARIIEVEIRLDDSARAADLTRLQVQVKIGS